MKAIRLHSGVSVFLVLALIPTLLHLGSPACVAGPLDGGARQGDDFPIKWTRGGVLHSRPGISAGDWGDVNGATSPHQFSPGTTSIEIFRLRSE